MCSALLISGARRPLRVLSEKGFTLLEIMVALAILGGVIVTALASISYHLSVVDTNINKTISAMLAVDKLEQVRLYGEPKTKDGGLGPMYEGFTWRYTSGSSPYAGMRTESMTVSRVDSGGVTIKTMIVEE